MMKTITVILLVLFMLAGCQPRQEIVTEYTSDPEENLHALWALLDERYCYFDAKNIDWDGVYGIYHAKLYGKQVWSVYEYFDLLAQMLDTLQDGHVNLYSPFDVSVCSGWYTDYPADYYSGIIYSDKYLKNGVRRAGGFVYGYLQGSDVGYIGYSSFSNGFSAANLLYMDNYFKDADGLVIDVRDNGGGSLDYSRRFASCFFKDKTVTGYIRHKIGAGHDDFSDPEPFATDPVDAPIDWSDRKVVVLTNRMCYSATNDFVVRMLCASNVIVVGGMTGGGGGMPLSQELPNGWMVRFSAVPMYDACMKHTEFGVMPDIEIHITAEDVLAGKDAILEKAVEILSRK
ncbi:MAG: S41 family peptidase [Candidatus Aphodosoma sp.]